MMEQTSHDVLHLPAIRTAWTERFADPALAQTVFDGAMAAWLTAAPVPFVHGAVAADPLLTITALPAALLPVLAMHVSAAYAQHSTLANDAAAYNLDLTAAARTAAADSALVLPANLAHTAKYYFSDYPALMLHLRTLAFANKKAISARQRAAKLATARAEREAAVAAFSPPPPPPFLSVPKGIMIPTLLADPVLGHLTHPNISAPTRTLPAVWQLAQDVAVAAQVRPSIARRFVSLDLEAFEFNHAQITEIGYVTADMMPLAVAQCLPLVSGVDHLVPLRRRLETPALAPLQKPPPLLVPGSPPTPPPTDHGGDDSMDVTESDPPHPENDPASTWVLVVRPRHVIVTDYAHLRNGVRVRDGKDSFLGTSTHLPKSVAFAHLDRVLADTQVLVGHSISSDLSFLRRARARVRIPPLVIDTQTIYKAQTGSVDTVRLSRILDALGVTYDEALLHNAGNDAVYTLWGMLRLVGVTG
ncbi:hypothetical protein BC828DRAFT_383570 [Blastocladiella britannica]|nr:hypothetical protein BC828DRAFT_383570 [Blastocladiella britannica]